MSPPEDCYYNDMYWEDLPEIAKKAAQTLGYSNAEAWDNDETVPYDDKSFADCTNAEKQAAMFLNLNPIGTKLNIWWEDVDATTKNHAINLGWTAEKWDEDYEIEHLDVEHLSWSDLDSKQKEAASYFGYTKATWDETWEASDFTMSSSSSSGTPHKPIHKPSNNKPNKKDDDEEDEEPQEDGEGKKPTKMFVPPPKGKIFGKKQDDDDDDKDEKKDDDHHHKFGDKLVQPFKKLFGKDHD